MHPTRPPSLTSTIRPVLLLEAAVTESSHGVPALLPRVVHLVPAFDVAPPHGVDPRREFLGRLRRGKLLQPLGRRPDLDGGDVANVVVVGVQVVVGEVAAVFVALVKVRALPGNEGDLDRRVGRPLVPNDAAGGPRLVLLKGGERRRHGVEDGVGGRVVQGAAEVGRGIMRPRRGGLPSHA